MDHQKVKMQQLKEREKNFSDYCPIIVRQKKGAFFRQGVLRKMCGKEQCRKEK